MSMTNYMDMMTSQMILEQGTPVSHLLQLSVSVNCPPLFFRLLSVLLVNAPKQPLKRERTHQSRSRERQARAKSSGVLRALLLLIDEAAHDTSQVADADHRRNTNGSLLRAGEVIDGPGIATRQDGIDTYASHMYCKVAERDVVFDVFGSGEENREGDDEEGLGRGDEGHAPREPVSEQGRDEGGDGATCVWWSCHELCFCGSEAHVLEDLRHGTVCCQEVSPIDESRMYTYNFKP